MNSITHFYLNSWMTLNICEVRGNVFLNSCEHHKLRTQGFQSDSIHLYFRPTGQGQRSGFSKCRECDSRRMSLDIFKFIQHIQQGAEGLHQQPPVYLFLEKGVYNHFTGSSSICCDLSLDNALLQRQINCNKFLDWLWY